MGQRIGLKRWTTTSRYAFVFSHCSYCCFAFDIFCRCLNAVRACRRTRMPELSSCMGPCNVGVLGGPGPPFATSCTTKPWALHLLSFGPRGCHMACQTCRRQCAELAALVRSAIALLIPSFTSRASTNAFTNGFGPQDLRHCCTCIPSVPSQTQQTGMALATAIG